MLKPTGEQVAAGVGAGMAGFDLSTDAATLADNVEAAVSSALTADVLATSANAALTSTTLKSVGVNAMRKTLRVAVPKSFSVGALWKAGVPRCADASEYGQRSQASARELERGVWRQRQRE